MLHRPLQMYTSLRSGELPDVAGLGGAVAGLLAGLTMIVVSPLLSWATGIGVWEPLKLIAATFLGPDAMTEPGFVLGPVLLGTALHLVVATLLGIVFGLLLNRVLHLTTEFGLSIYVGLVYGLLIFFAAYFVVLPLANPTLRGTDMSPVLVQNLVLGVVVGLFYTFVRPLPYRAPRDERQS